MRNRTTAQETPLITCEFYFSSLQPITTRWLWNQDHVSVTCLKGQARIIESPVTLTTAQTGRGHPRGVNIERSRPLTKTNTFPLDESRWVCVNASSHQASVLGMYPLAPAKACRFDDGLLEQQNGINEVFLFLHADLRTMLFSA